MNFRRFFNRNYKISLDARRDIDTFIRLSTLSFYGLNESIYLNDIIKDREYLRSKKFIDNNSWFKPWYQLLSILGYFNSNLGSIVRKFSDMREENTDIKNFNIKDINIERFNKKLGLFRDENEFKSNNNEQVNNLKIRNDLEEKIRLNLINEYYNDYKTIRIFRREIKGLYEIITNDSMNKHFNDKRIYNNDLIDYIIFLKEHSGLKSRVLSRENYNLEKIANKEHSNSNLLNYVLVSKVIDEINSIYENENLSSKKFVENSLIEFNNLMETIDSNKTVRESKGFGLLKERVIPVHQNILNKIIFINDIKEKLDDNNYNGIYESLKNNSDTLAQYAKTDSYFMDFMDSFKRAFYDDSTNKLILKKTKKLMSELSKESYENYDILLTHDPIRLLMEYKGLKSLGNT